MIIGLKSQVLLSVIHAEFFIEQKLNVWFWLVKYFPCILYFSSGKERDEAGGRRDENCSIK